MTRTSGVPLPLPRPGEVYVVPVVPDLNVEWAVLERDPAAPRVFAVPADTRDLVGSRDLQVWEVSSRLPLSLRCGLGLWLPARAFDPELRTGMVDDDGLVRARAAAGPRAREATAAQHRTDADPAYREWLRDVPERAREALSRSFSEGAAPERSAAKYEVSAGSRPWRFTAVAAALVLAAGGGWIGWRLAESGRPPTADAMAAEATVNVVSVRLLRLRGRQRITMPAGAGALLLLIDPPGGVPDGAYRVELRSGDPERTVWSGEGLRLAGDAELLSVSLPAPLVPPGAYRVVLSTPEGRGEPPLAEHAIVIERGR